MPDSINLSLGSLTPAELATLHAVIDLMMMRSPQDPILRRIHDKVKAAEERALLEHGREALTDALKQEIQDALAEVEQKRSSDPAGAELLKRLGKIQGPML